MDCVLRLQNALADGASSWFDDTSNQVCSRQDREGHEGTGRCLSVVDRAHVAVDGGSIYMVASHHPDCHFQRHLRAGFRLEGGGWRVEG